VFDFGGACSWAQYRMFQPWPQTRTEASLLPMWSRQLRPGRRKVRRSLGFRWSAAAFGKADCDRVLEFGWAHDTAGSAGKEALGQHTGPGSADRILDGFAMESTVDRVLLAHSRLSL
jgi:hypothetical protein